MPHNESLASIDLDSKVLTAWPIRTNSLSLYITSSTTVKKKYKNDKE